MSKKKIGIIVLLFIGLFLNIKIFLQVQPEKITNIQLQITVMADKIGEYKIYYSETEQFAEEQSVWEVYSNINKNQEMIFLFPESSNYIRIDFPEIEGTVQVSNLKFQYQNKEIELENNWIKQENLSQLTVYREENGIYQIKTEGGDPYIFLDLSEIPFQKYTENANHIKEILLKVGLCLILGE